MKILALVNCGTIVCTELKKSPESTTKVSETLTQHVTETGGEKPALNITQTKDSTIKKEDKFETLITDVGEPGDLTVEVGELVATEPPTPPLTRVKRIHLFRPLFVYRQEEIKRKRLNGYLSDRNSYKRKGYYRNQYYNPNAVSPSSQNYDPVDAYPYDRNDISEKLKSSRGGTRRPSDYGSSNSGNEDYYQGQKFLSENQRSYSNRYEQDRPVYERRPTKPYSDYYQRSRHLGEDSRYDDPSYYNSHYRP